jgi:hypothetical protein
MTPRSWAPSPEPLDPGEEHSVKLPPGGQRKRFVAIRAVDEQGNVGRAAVVDLGG